MCCNMQYYEIYLFPKPKKVYKNKLFCNKISFILNPPVYSLLCITYLKQNAAGLSLSIREMRLAAAITVRDRTKTGSALAGLPTW